MTEPSHTANAISPSLFAVVGHVVNQVMPLLAGLLPEVQGAILADLLSIFIAGHTPQIRDEILDTHIKVVRELIQINEQIMFGDKGHPDQ